MNHGVVGMVGGDVRKVRCNTCLSEHVFRHGKIPARRRNETSKLFDEVLRGVARPSAAPAVPSGDESSGAPGAPGAPEEGAAPPPPPAHRRLYTIRRTTGGKGPGQGHKKS